MSQKQKTDDRMLDWLYGELDGESSARFEAELAEDPIAMEEAASFRRTREILAQVQDHEPPASLSSALLHAAAKEVAHHSPAHAERPGLFARFLAGLQSLGARPGLAAAAGLVVVVGVAGALYVRGDLASTADSAKASSPSLASAASEEVPEAKGAIEQPSPALKEAPATTLAAQPTDGADNDDGAADEGGAEGEAVGGGKDRVGYLADDQQRRELRRQAVKQQEERQKSFSDSKRGLVAKSESDSRRDDYGSKLDANKAKKKAPRFADAPAQMAKRPPSTANAVSSGDYASPVGGAVADDEMSPGDSRLSVVGAVEEKSKNRGYKRRKLDDDWAKASKAKLSKAVKKKDCNSAARIANDILDRHPQFYYQELRGSSELRKCQWYVSAESKRRAQLRAKKGAGGSSANTAAPAKAAPKRRMQRDEAAAESVE